MKVFLDDKRDAHEGWVRVHSAKEAIDLLDTGNVEEISLDHDLSLKKRDSGYEVILHIERKVVADRNFRPPIIHIHTANPSARQKMELGVKSIKRLAARNKERK